MYSQFNKKQIGEIGELVAAEYYLNKGYALLFKNWRWSNKGELDLILYNQDDDILVICEVKTRKTGALINGVYSVNKNKQTKIRMLSYVFIQKHKFYEKSNVRFDVADLIFNTITGKIDKITIFENAF